MGPTIDQFSNTAKSRKSQFTMYPIDIILGDVTGYTGEARMLTPRSTSSAVSLVDIVAMMSTGYT